MSLTIESQTHPHCLGGTYDFPTKRVITALLINLKRGGNNPIPYFAATYIHCGRGKWRAFFIDVPPGEYLAVAVGQDYEIVSKPIPWKGYHGVTFKSATSVHAEGNFSPPTSKVVSVLHASDMPGGQQFYAPKITNDASTHSWSADYPDVQPHPSHCIAVGDDGSTGFAECT